MARVERMTLTNKHLLVLLAVCSLGTGFILGLLLEAVFATRTALFVGTLLGTPVAFYTFSRTLRK